MQGIKNILDNLELIGHPLDDGATVIHSRNGLGPNYLPLASTIRARDTRYHLKNFMTSYLIRKPFSNVMKPKRVALR